MAQHHSNDGAIRLDIDTPGRTTSLALSVAVPPWMKDAICVETDPEAFFPEKGESTREAKRICAGCPVQVECLDYALANEERFGIWGGVSERDRRRLTRRPLHTTSPNDDLDQQESA